MVAVRGEGRETKNEEDDHCFLQFDVVSSTFWMLLLPSPDLACRRR